VPEHSRAQEGGGLTRRAADSRRFAPLAADATVSCATVVMSVTHHAPSPSGSVPRVPTPATSPASHPSTHARSLCGPRRADARIRAHAAVHGSGMFLPSSSPVPGAARSAPHHIVPGLLVLAHLARTRSFVFGRGLRSRVQGIAVSVGAHAHQPGPFTENPSMPSFTAHRLRGTVPSSTSPAKATGAAGAGFWPRPHSGALAPSTRTANPACSGLAALRAARR
jgi:hypothetical protein